MSRCRSLAFANSLFPVIIWSLSAAVVFPQGPVPPLPENSPEQKVQKPVVEVVQQPEFSPGSGESRRPAPASPTARQGRAMLPRDVPSLTVDAARPVPFTAGSARLHIRDAITVEPFCEIPGAIVIPESGPSEHPRCAANRIRTSEYSFISESGGCSQRSEPIDGRTAADGKLRVSDQTILTAVFSEAACFAISEAGSPHSVQVLAGASQRSPIMIYEGMSVTVYADGRYEMRALLDGPRTPAILRLQLHFAVPEGDIAQVTLPPVRLIPSERSPADLPNESQTWFVRRTGWSPLLADLQASHQITVRRSGTSQSGSLPSL